MLSFFKKKFFFSIYTILTKQKQSFLSCDKFCTSAFGHYLPFFSSPLHLSSSVRLDGADAHFQVSPEMFDWVQAQAVSGTLKDIHRVVYKSLLLCAWGHCPVGM